jgi:hypothetical protein
MKEKGVMYIATGEKYIQEAALSVKSLNSNSPKLSTVLFTDNSRGKDNIFTDIVKIDEPKYPYLKRIELLLESPFEKTLFLDTDTYIVKDISNIFDILDRFGFAASHAPIREAPRRSSPGGGYSVEGVPDTFPELNGGVLLFEKNEKTISMIRDWKKVYKDALNRIGEWRNDQPALKKSLYESSVRFAVLPREYNLRKPYPGYIYGDAKIIHGRGSDIPKIAKKCNKEKGPRVYIPGIGVIRNYNIILKLIRKAKSFLSS